MPPLTPTQLRTVEHDLDNGVMPSPTAVRALAEEVRDLRRTTDDLTQRVTLLAAAADNAARLLADADGARKLLTAALRKAASDG